MPDPAAVQWQGDAAVAQPGVRDRYTVCGQLLVVLPVVLRTQSGHS